MHHGHGQQSVPHCALSLSEASQQYAQHSYCAPAPYPSYTFHSYPAYVSQYHQQYATPQMVQMISHDENRVLVSDGYSWKEYDLEKVFLAKNLPPGE